jgi:hypothetical protein
MLEAANADLVFTISLKRSTPNLLLSTNSPADYPIYPGRNRGTSGPGADMAKTFILTQLRHSPNSVVVADYRLYPLVNSGLVFPSAPLWQKCAIRMGA